MLLFEHLQGGSPDLRDVRVGDGSSKRGDGGQLSPRLCSVWPHVTTKVVEAAGKSGDERLHLGGVDDEPREARCDVSLNVGVEGQGRVDGRTDAVGEVWGKLRKDAASAASKVFAEETLARLAERVRAKMAAKGRTTEYQI